MATQITGITANLSLETAAFIRDLSKASQAVARNTSAMKRSFDSLNRSMSVIKGAAAGFISVAALRQFARLGMTAIETADDIGKASTALGIGAEELQRFRFAAAQADVSTEELDASFRMFLKNASTGKIKAVGNDAADGFKNYIEQIAKAPTLLEKVNLAQAAFGKQYQTALLLAAQGADEFRRQFDKANVVSQKAVDIASRLDNQLREISTAAEAGFQTGFLEGFAGKLDDSTSAADRTAKAMFTLGQAMAGIVTKVVSLIDKVDKFANEHPVLFDLLLNPLPTTIFNGGDQPKLPSLSFDDMQSGLNKPKPTGVDPAQFDLGTAAINAQTQAMMAWETETTDALGRSMELNELQKEGVQVFADLQTPMEQYASTIQRLQALRDADAISAETWAAANRQAAFTVAETALDAASALSGALAAAFKENKAFAIANAIISTAQGIAGALKLLPSPLAWVYAAAAAVTGAAQIATITSTEPGSSKAIKKPSGGASGAAKAGSASRGGGGTTNQQAVTINVTGESFGPDHFRRLVEGLNGVIKDGAVLRVNK